MPQINNNEYINPKEDEKIKYNDKIYQDIFHVAKPHLTKKLISLQVDKDIVTLHGNETNHGTLAGISKENLKISAFIDQPK